MSKFYAEAALYHQYHQKRSTVYTHFIGVPLILFGFLILLGYVHIIIPSVLHMTLADILVIVLIGYYLYLNWRLGLLAIPFLAIMLWISTLLSFHGPSPANLWLLVICLIIGSGLLFLGHLQEGSKPAFLRDFKMSLLGPLFLTAEVVIITGYMPSLKKEIYGEEATERTTSPSKQEEDV